MSVSAYEQGRLAFRHNHPMSSCTYPVGSSLRAEWMSGWTEARLAEERRAHREPAAKMMREAWHASRLAQPTAHES